MAVVIEHINMNPREARCFLCDEWHDFAQGVPTVNGDLVSNDFPQDCQAWKDWGGVQPVCAECYAKHERGETPSFDKYYVPRAPMGVTLISGAGI